MEYSFRSIIDQQLSKLPNDIVHIFYDSWLTGGAIANIILGRKDGDFDFILTTRHLAEAKRYFVDIYDRQKPEINFDNISISLAATVDFLKKPVGDFLHTTAYYDLLTDKLYLTDEELQCILHKYLVASPDWERMYKRERILKYLSLGWTTTDPKVIAGMV